MPGLVGGVVLYGDYRVTSEDKDLTDAYSMISMRKAPHASPSLDVAAIGQVWESAGLAVWMRRMATERPGGEVGESGNQLWTIVASPGAVVKMQQPRGVRIVWESVSAGVPVTAVVDPSETVLTLTAGPEGFIVRIAWQALEAIGWDLLAANVSSGALATEMARWHLLDGEAAWDRARPTITRLQSAKTGVTR